MVEGYRGVFHGDDAPEVSPLYPGARAVLDGVKTYFTSQPPPGTLFAAQAAARGGSSAGVSGGSR